MNESTAPFPGYDLVGLFDYLPMVVFYSKDKDGMFLRINRRFEEMHGLEHGTGVGLTDYDLFTTEIACRYRAEDKLVMDSGKPMPNRAWIVPDGKGVLHWWISSKTPLKDAQGNVCGVAGAMYEIAGVGGMMEPFARLEPALELMHGNPAEAITTDSMASACNYSVSQFNRVFRQLMGQSPKQYLVRLRLELAKGLLSQTDDPVSEIAMNVGFYDASVLGKKFRENEGLTPRQYRMKLRELVKFSA